MHARLGTNVITGLPSSSGPRQAADAAAEGFGPGIVGPTTLILQGSGVASQTAASAASRRVIRRSPGVSAVVGPGELPLHFGASAFATSSGNAVRALRRPSRRSLRLARRSARSQPCSSACRASLSGAGLRSATVAWSGATPAAADAVAATNTDIWRVALLAALLMSLVLMLYFRAVPAPLLLIASSALGLAASLGVFVLVFQGPLGYPDVTFFVPVTAGVLLVSLGADYSVFVMGRIWEESRTRDMAAAVEAALPRASRAVSIAAADPGREFRGPGARAGAALPGARVHHGRGSPDRRIPGALVPASCPARSGGTARVLAASEGWPAVARHRPEVASSATSEPVRADPGPSP